MANEITKLGGDGHLNAQLLFIYRGITAPTYTKADTSTAVIIPTPSATLPDIAIDVVTVAEKAALDAGTDVFEVVTMEVSDGLSNADLLVKAREIYAESKAAYIAKLTRQYKRVGQRFNEV